MDDRTLFDYTEEEFVEWFRGVVIEEWFNDVFMQPPVFPEMEAPILKINEPSTIPLTPMAPKSFVPVTISVSSMPSGMSYDSDTNEITGTPTQLKVFSVLPNYRRRIRITATNRFGESVAWLDYQVEGPPATRHYRDTMNVPWNRVRGRGYRVGYIDCVPVGTLEHISGSPPDGLLPSIVSNESLNGWHLSFNGVTTASGISTVTYRATNKHGSIDMPITFNVSEAPDESE